MLAVTSRMGNAVYLTALDLSLVTSDTGTVTEFSLLGE